MSITANEEFKPKIVAFCCNWCSYAGADLAGSSLLGYDHENGGMERVRMREKEEYVMSQLGLPGTSSYTV